MAVLNESILHELEQKRFSILDVMRERTMMQKPIINVKYWDWCWLSIFSRAWSISTVRS